MEVMEEVHGDDMSLGKAIEATETLTLRELGSHAHVGPLPLGSVSPMMLPLMSGVSCSGVAP